MTSRERLLTTLRGGIADRVPVAPFVQEEYLAYYYPQKAQVDRVVDAVELAHELDFDLMAKHRALELPARHGVAEPRAQLAQRRDLQVHDPPGTVHNIHKSTVRSKRAAHRASGTGGCQGGHLSTQRRFWPHAAAWGEVMVPQERL